MSSKDVDELFLKWFDTKSPEELHTIVMPFKLFQQMSNQTISVDDFTFRAGFYTGWRLKEIKEGRDPDRGHKPVDR